MNEQKQNSDEQVGGEKQTADTVECPGDGGRRPDYIVDQRELCRVKYGGYMSDYDGCGWIAVYNTLLTLGETPDRDALISDFERHGLVLGGKLGTNAFYVRRYLKKRGYICRFFLRGKKLRRCADSFDAGILLYLHRHGAHYISVRPLGDGKLQVFNDIMGSQDDVREADALARGVGFMSAYLMVKR